MEFSGRKFRSRTVKELSDLFRLKRGEFNGGSGELKINFGLFEYEMRMHFGMALESDHLISVCGKKWWLQGYILVVSDLLERR
ncbi:hypothetical protein CEXT_776631 [Caerostris extrusa]|uniref:Uncharacterized protein n=1 Tax=Caerostris extrusa TaxID=172846 RepID=A0AAV4WI83_CAEEX|nr:hypothetical protein CEXT_776631 [Caerostris extrusa]